MKLLKSLTLTVGISALSLFTYYACKSTPTIDKAISQGASQSASMATESTDRPQRLPLKDAYRSFFPIGAAVDDGVFLDDDSYSKFLATQYSSLTPANQLKPKRIHAEEKTFSWSKMDKLVLFARNHQMKVRGHYLIAGSDMPAWFYHDGNKLASKELLLQRIEDHIKTVVKKYEKDVYCWDVVNEAVAQNYKRHPFKYNDTLYQILGEEYIAKAFEFARKAAPNAKLFYNDNKFEDPGKRKHIYDLISKLKKRGVPIDGIGIQCHTSIEGLSEVEFTKTIKEFAGLGLEVQITELDVSMYPVGIKANSVKRMANANTAENLKKQADIYEMVFRVCRENKALITGLTMWAPADWDNSLTTKIKVKNYPYLFDRSLKPKAVVNKITEF